MHTNKIDIHPHGFVELVSVLGNDQRVVEAARVSVHGGSKGEEADKKLLFYLYKNRHTSPFEQCNLTFVIKMPIFVMRQFVRHRTFRLNEWSARYSELQEDFFLPVIWREQSTTNKQGSTEGNRADNWHEENDKLARDVYDATWAAYQNLLKRGVARELARIVLPVGIYTQIMVNVDLHNLMHFLRLRLDFHAQQEIRDVAQAMCNLAKPHFPWTFEAFERYKVTVTET